MEARKYPSAFVLFQFLFPTRNAPVSEHECGALIDAAHFWVECLFVFDYTPRRQKEDRGRDGASDEWCAPNCAVYSCIWFVDGLQYRHAKFCASQRRKRLDVWI